MITNKTKTMKTKLLMLIAALIMGLAAQTQIIQNGVDWIDNDYDNIGDGWTVGDNTLPDIDSGQQYISCMTGGVELKQLFTIPASTLVYAIEMDVYSTMPLYVHLGVGSISFVACYSTGSGYEHLTGTFINTQGIHDIKIISVDPGMAWVDNVTIYPIYPVGIAEHSQQGGELEYFDMMGRRLRGEPESGVFIRVVNGRGKTIQKGGAK